MQLIETGFKELFVLQAQAFEDDRVVLNLIIPAGLVLKTI